MSGSIRTSRSTLNVPHVPETTPMTFSIPRLLFVLAALSCLYVVTPVAEVSAQEWGQAGTFLALVDDFPGDLDARSLLVREPGRDVVLLRAGQATTETLSMALAVLDRVRTKPLAAGQGQLIPITGFVMTDPPARAHERRLAAALSRLERASVVEVGRYGPGRVIHFR